MTRIACLLLPQLGLQSLLRAEPELADAPLVVCQGREVIELSVAARRLGLQPGMTIVQAQATAPEAIYRARSPELCRSAEAALFDLGRSFSPRIECWEGGLALDVSDLGRLFASEAELAQSLDLGARRLGLRVRVGIAADKITAKVAARVGTMQVVPPGREAPFLAPLPVGLLEPSPAARATLRRWGVRTIGELEALPAGGVAVRLGAEGARLGRVARGEAEAVLTPRPEPERFAEGIDLDWPVETVEPLAFVLRRLLDNLTARLGCRGLAAGDLGLVLKLSPRGRDVRTVSVAAPTREVGTLLALVRLALETSPPAQAVEGIVVSTTPAAPRTAQLDLFAPAGPAPDKLATTLARLTALVGESRVGAPALVDRHLPEAYTVEAFCPPPRARVASSRADDGAANGSEHPERRQLALHALRPPLTVEAHLDRGCLRYLAGGGYGGQVLAAAGPFRLRDGWWQLPVLRDYYDVQLSDGAIYRVFHDLLTDAWHMDGVYE